MKALKDITLIGVGVIIMSFIPDREKEKIKTELEEAHLIINKLEQQSKKPGGFVLLNKEMKSITFENFEGTVIWYQTYDAEKLTGKYSSINFHPIQADEIVEGKKIPSPPKARAFLLQGQVIKGNEYSIHYGYDE